MPSQRIFDELKALGFHPAGMNNGVPYGDWEPNDPIATLAIALHEPDDEVYRLQGLNLTAAALKAIVSPNQWKKYGNVQTKLIKALRKEACLNAGDLEGDFLQALMAGQSLNAACSVIEDDLAAIAAAYPFPGEY